MISKDPHYGEFHISDGEIGYVLNKSGLSRAPWAATRVSFSQGGLVGITFPDSDEVMMVSEKFTNTGAAPGQVAWVRLYGQNDDSDPWRVAIDYRLKTSNDWTRTDFVDVDGRGVALVRAPGMEWRLVAKCTDRAGHTLENAEVYIAEDGKYNASDWLAAATPSAATE